MIYRLSLITLVASILCGCTTGQMVVNGVGYQSLRTDFAQPAEIPSDAKIAVEFFFNDEGVMQPVVYNLTSEIMILDQTKSFLILPGGNSLSYFDPNTYTTTNGEFSSNTNSSSFNLGAIANVLGLGGPLGSILNSTTVGSSSTNGIIRQNSVSRTDQPLINIGPKGTIAMSKAYKVSGVGELGSMYNGNFVDSESNSSPVKFSTCITYSVDDGASYKKLITNFYVSSNIYEKTDKKNVTKAFVNIYNTKPDALAENMYMFIISNNIDTTIKRDDGSFIPASNLYTKFIQGSLLDFQ